MQKIVRDPVNIPGDADGIDQTHAKQQPPGRNRENGKKGQYIGEMQDTTDNGHSVPFGICQDLHTDGLYSPESAMSLPEVSTETSGSAIAHPLVRQSSRAVAMTCAP